MTSGEPARSNLVEIPCPLCQATAHQPWGTENGFACVRCRACGILYVNPRPVTEHIDRAVQLGVHAEEQADLNVIGSRVGWKVRTFQRVLRRTFPDVQTRTTPIRWLDVGAGFGEFVEAVASIAPPGSVCEGIEPMKPKAEAAQKRGLPIRAAYMQDIAETYDFVSLIDVFSHIPDFGGFLEDTKKLLNPGGEIFLKTGNAAELDSREQFPGPLTLPDHLVFAGERHLSRYLRDAGYSVLHVRRERLDGVRYSLRNVAKWLLRKPVRLSIPYTSPTRVLYIRAKLLES
jgi:2-polyprenyl-3-methyl-5-hydroxy-6-metoxy-1,4-benzoquinol methylase